MSKKCQRCGWNNIETREIPVNSAFGMVLEECDHWKRWCFFLAVSMFFTIVLSLWCLRSVVQGPNGLTDADRVAAPSNELSAAMSSDVVDLPDVTGLKPAIYIGNGIELQGRDALEYKRKCYNLFGEQKLFAGKWYSVEDFTNGKLNPRANACPNNGMHPVEENHRIHTAPSQNSSTRKP